MIVLGIETSCDETAIGIVDEQHRILANCVATQFADHKPYGGVVPEIAARAHLEKLAPLVQSALALSGLSLAQLSGIAATAGPGLIGGVMVGATMAKAISAVMQLPFLAVNHLEAHALTARLTHQVEFPYLLLLVSGGHCQLLLAEAVGQYRQLGTTIDDAVGECFDKGAKLLGLGYPGGPLIERAALSGNPEAYDLPRPLLNRAGCDFSFSGLKTALRILVERHLASTSQVRAATNQLDTQFVADAAACLQAAIADILQNRVSHALAQLAVENQPLTALVVGGGVAANKMIGSRLAETAANATQFGPSGLPFVAPPVPLCTDNGVMVAWAGLEKLRLGQSDDLSFATRPRWPLSMMS